MRTKLRSKSRIGSCPATGLSTPGKKLPRGRKAAYNTRLRQSCRTPWVWRMSLYSTACCCLCLCRTPSYSWDLRKHHPWPADIPPRPYCAASLRTPDNIQILPTLSRSLRSPHQHCTKCSQMSRLLSPKTALCRRCRELSPAQCRLPPGKTAHNSLCRQDRPAGS